MNLVAVISHSSHMVPILGYNTVPRTGTNYIPVYRNGSAARHSILGARLLSHGKKLDERPHGNPLNVLLATLVRQNSYANRLRLHTLKCLDRRPNRLSHPENRINDQHFLPLDGRKARIDSTSDLLLPQPLGSNRGNGFSEGSSDDQAERHSPSFNPCNNIRLLHRPLFDSFSNHIRHRPPDQG